MPDAPPAAKYLHPDDDWSECTATGPEDLEMSGEHVLFCRAHDEVVEENTHE